jgi:cephalosporin hydroxylase
MSDEIAAFHKRYYDSEVWRGRTHWLGVPTQKTPFDLWIYQELLVELRPDLVVETGTADGGSALYLASICDLIQHGRVLTIDVREAERPAHPRIAYMLGSSTERETVERVRHEAENASAVLAILDSDHAAEHVLAELRAYAPLVTPGSYLIVEDTNINGHPVLPDFGDGPAEAVASFLAETDEFTVDHSLEKFGFTFNPGGYLRRR